MDIFFDMYASNRRCHEIITCKSIMYSTVENAKAKATHIQLIFDIINNPI